MRDVPLPVWLLVALVALAAGQYDAQVGTNTYGTDYGAHEGGYVPPDHGTTGFEIWTLDYEFEKCAARRRRRARYRGGPVRTHPHATARAAARRRDERCDVLDRLVHLVVPRRAD